MYSYHIVAELRQFRGALAAAEARHPQERIGPAALGGNGLPAFQLDWNG
jgi:hypothetical protein